MKPFTISKDLSSPYLLFHVFEVSDSNLQHVCISMALPAWHIKNAHGTTHLWSLAVVSWFVFVEWANKGQVLLTSFLNLGRTLTFLLTRHAKLSHTSAHMSRNVLLGPTSDIPKLPTLTMPISTVWPKHKCYDEQELQLHAGGRASPIQMEPKKQTQKERNFRFHLYKVSKQMRWTSFYTVKDGVYSGAK